MSMNWLGNLKIALVERDIPKIEELMGTMPEFVSLKEMQAASDLLEASRELVESEKAQLLKKMQENRKARKFLSESKRKTKFDIQS